MNDLENNQILLDIQREYLEFLDDEEDQGIYYRRVKDMIENKKRRILVNINDLRKKNSKRANSLLKSSGEEHMAFQNALKEYVSTIDPNYEYDEFFIGLEGSFGNKHLTPRTLTSVFLNSIVCLEGIVTQCSLVKPKLVRSVHYCPATQKMSERKYTDLTSLNPVLTSSVYPTKDAEGNLLETEFGLSSYKDHQTLIIQEMPEKAPAGQLPRAIDIVCDQDLADKCKPGDRVQIVGLYRCLPGKQGGFTSGIFRTVLLANNISHLSKDTKLVMSRADISNCRKLAKKKNIFELLSHSLAPSIHGHEYVKKAILCMLLGGVEKVLPNGTRLRGDINILLIGDPSVAKSQLLRYVLCTAPRAIATTGRGSSGVGLTAAVTSDHETGERRLEAGAMVLADRGIVCIDEFDKMSDMDRTAIHEVMEQGKVTIAKAGIHAQLNARCCVLAAANPVYGKYDEYKPPMENIGLQDSLLSRFDLLFVMLDVIDSDIDSMISDHVVRIHRYRNPDEQDGEVLPMGSSVDILTTQSMDINTSEHEPSIYEKYDPLLHGESRSKTDRIFSMKFMRMYIHIAKTLRPILTEEASIAIAEEYSRLRSQDNVESGVARTQPVTVRTLETLIRLSTAHAKARLACKVQIEDAQAAIELVQFAYFKKVLDKEKKRRRDSEGDDLDDVEAPARKSSRTSASVQQTETTLSPEVDSIQGSSDVLTSESSAPEKVKITSITNERLSKFRLSASACFQDKNVQWLDMSYLIQYINKEHSAQPFSKEEISSAIQRMTDDNQIMVSEDMVFLI